MRASKFRNEISGFQQHELESLHEAWQRYKGLQRQCPHHEIPEWLLIQTFYNGLKHEVRSSIDAASGGTFMAKTPEATKIMLDDMAANNYLNDWSVPRGAPKRGGKYEVDAIATLTNTVQVLAVKVDQLSSGCCEICEVQGHSFNECQYNTMGAAKQIEYQAKQNDFFSNSLQQIHAHNKMMENQTTQLAQQISHLSKPPGQLPGQTEPNPKGFIHAISLRSGRELQDPYRKVNDQRNSVEESKNLSDKDQGENVLEDEAKETEKKEPVVIPIAPYKPPVPFPQRLAQAKLEKKYGKFLDILKKLHINIPFLDAISEMPSYAKFLKDMLSNRRKIEENVTVSLIAECSAIL
ncbi:uncharacterized protein LOC125495640 [Beta vulgaris subsp. vulgaris]|uniref:uncharacterized protein LOC125495640 n=1 Tax=Beta vulgaris subsp. vulgaris TaxID=3555 RepID=UPI0020373988|nr:uncharacterized protein LOC125495640 [Beta vulgaris subsp. vulgaris]